MAACHSMFIAGAHSMHWECVPVTALRQIGHIQGCDVSSKSPEES